MELEPTGERYLPNCMKGQIKYEHLHRYALSIELVRDKQVLDIASGEGYGSASLSKFACSVVGVDIDSKSVEYANQKYGDRPNLEFVVGACEAIPLPSQSVDIVTSFETIEHHNKHEEMMQEIKRVLKPGGLVIISSPNRLTYSDLPEYSNPFHVKELYDYQFISLLNRHFKHVKIYGQRLATGSFVFPLKDTSQPSFNAYTFDESEVNQKVCSLEAPIYFIALCSDEVTNVQAAIDSIYIDKPDDLFKENQVALAEFQSQLHQTKALLSQYQSQLHQTEVILMQCQSQLQDTEAVLEESQSQLQDIEAVLEESQSQLHQTQTELAQSQSQLHETQAEVKQSQSQQAQTEAELAQTQIKLKQSQSQQAQTASELAQAKAQLHETDGVLEQSQSQLHQTQEVLERLLFQQSLVATQTEGQLPMQYKLLLWDAWYAYRKGDMAAVALCLQQSLKCTPLSRTETLVNWLESFANFSSDQGCEFDSYSLTSSAEWKQLMRSVTAVRAVVAS